MIYLGEMLTVPIRSRIKEVLADRGIKQKWVAEKLGIKPPYFSQMIKTDTSGRLENAMSAEYLLKLAHVIGCKVEDIAEYIEEG